MFKKHIFLSFFIILLSPSIIHAQTVDSSAIQMYQTVGFFDPDTTEFGIMDLMVGSPLSRMPNVFDKVEGIPGAKFNLIYMYDNYSSSSIHVEKIYLPLSQNDASGGDLTNLITIEHTSGNNIHTRWGNIDLYREGKGKEYLVNMDLSGYGSVLLDTFEIGNSLEIESWDITPDYDNNLIYMTVYVRNMVPELLNNVVFTHDTYSYTQNILPEGQVIYQYNLDLEITEGEDIDLGNIEIEDPNIKTECAVQGSRWYQAFYTNALSMYSYINTSWINGLYTQPERESMCVTRLPHTITSDTILFEHVDNVVEKLDQEPQILGVSAEIFNNLEELPKTSRGYLATLICLLVADMYLWYSLFNKRKNYESKNNNT